MTGLKIFLVIRIFTVQYSFTIWKFSINTTFTHQIKYQSVPKHKINCKHFTSMLLKACDWIILWHCNNFQCFVCFPITVLHRWLKTVLPPLRQQSALLINCVRKKINYSWIEIVDVLKASNLIFVFVINYCKYL